MEVVVILRKRSDCQYTHTHIVILLCIRRRTRTRLRRSSAERFEPVSRPARERMIESYE